jgi:hypothetical protein
MAQAAAAKQNVANIKDAKKDEKAQTPRQTLFALKKSYADSKKNKLTLFCKQQKDGSFKVWAIHQKAGAKKQRGMVQVFQPTEQAKAEAKFTEIASVAEKNNWKMTLTSAKSAFDVIPVAE